MSKSKRSLLRTLANAETYDDWKDAAIDYDRFSGSNRWRKREKCNLYDYKEIRSRLETIKQLREENDNQGLLFTLNEGIHGNMGGMGSSKLYRKSKFGTKHLIENYIDEVNSALLHLSKPRIKGITQTQRQDFFQRANLCFGQSALLLSGAGTFLFFHLGVLKALWEQDLIPEIVSGASGGAFIAAVAGTRSPEQLAEIFDPNFVDLETELQTILGGVFPLKEETDRREDLEKIINKLIPDLTFEEAYKISGLQINISITPAEAHQKSRLLNAITSPNVLIREAVLASCCLPGLYAPVTLAAKDMKGEKVPYLPTRKWVDGSLSDDLPMKRLSRLYAVNHFIVSQTNPIALPFLADESTKGSVLSTLGQTTLKTAKDWGLAAGHIIQKPLKRDSYVSKLLNSYMSVVSQTYAGDINIMPANRYINPAQIVAVRSNEEIADLIRDGERAAWPTLERIRIQTKISRTLANIVKRLNNPIKSVKKVTQLKPRNKKSASSGN